MSQASGALYWTNLKLEREKVRPVVSLVSSFVLSNFTEDRRKVIEMVIIKSSGRTSIIRTKRTKQIFVFPR